MSRAATWRSNIAGRRPKRSAAGACGRSGAPPGERDCGGRQPSGAGGQGGDDDNSDCLLCRARSDCIWPCRQLEPAGRQRHGCYQLERGAGAEAAGVAARAGSRGNNHCGARRPNQSRRLVARPSVGCPYPRVSGLVFCARAARVFDAVFSTLHPTRGGGLMIRACSFPEEANPPPPRPSTLPFLSSRRPAGPRPQPRQAAKGDAPRTRNLYRPHPQGREARPTCRSSSRPSSSWSSTSRPPRRSASTVPPTLLAIADEVIE